jgi:two-component system, LuxR family, sensor histidine kinase DctS
MSLKLSQSLSAMGRSGPEPPSWLWQLPRIVLPLLLVLVVALVWLVDRREDETERQSLLNGVLWANQNIRTHAAAQIEQLTALGNDFAVRDYNAVTFRVRARETLRNAPGLIAIAAFGGDGKMLYDYAFVAQADRAEHLKSVASLELIARAARAGQATFGPPYTGADAQARIDLVIPIAAGSDLQGYVGGTLSLAAIMQDWTPAWYAQRYQLEVLDRSGNRIASTAQAADATQGLSHEAELEPFGHGLRLRATKFGSEQNWVPALLLGAVVLLTTAILWSAFALRRHVRERLSAQRELAREAGFRKAMENSIVTGMRARDLSGCITYVNRAFCELTGFSADELLGTRPPHLYWAPEVKEESQALFEKIVSGAAPPDGFELLIKRRNGDRLTVLIHEAPLIDETGRHVGWMGSVIDITQRKRTEELARLQQEQLQHTSRLVTMGEMASTLAHELNQPLTVINSYAVGSLNRLGDNNVVAQPSDQRLAFERIAEQAHRAGKIIHWVHEFVKRRQPDMQPLPINDVVERACSMVEATVRRSSTTLIVNLPTDVAKVVGDRVMLEQVLVNLIRNAIEAMAKGPPIAPTLRVDVTFTAESVRVAVTDSGEGVPIGMREQLFTPFFSTKANGMGMGLHASKSILEAHHGTVGYQPAEPPPGSLFWFSVPRHH